MVRYLAIFVCSFVLCLSGISARAASATRTTLASATNPPRVPTWNTHIIPYKKFSIHYTVRDVDGIGPKTVEFYITEDMGKTWVRYAEDPDAKSPMTVAVAREGTYGFMTVGTDHVGNRERAPSPGTRPETIVIVDRTKPTARWLAPKKQSLLSKQGILLAWESSDRYPRKRPVSIEYTTDNGKVWLPLQSNLPAKGRHTWRPPARIGNSLGFRLIVRDQAGNRLVLVNPNTTVLDAVPPRVQLTGPTMSRQNVVNLNYVVRDNVGGSGISRVRLYYTLDDGNAWKMYGDDPDKQSPFRFESVVGGRIGIALVATDNANNSSGQPRSGVRPPFYLTIDNEAPVVGELDPTFPDPNRRALRGNNQIDVRWRASDANIKANSATLSLSVNGGTSWRTLATNLPVNGPYNWLVPGGLNSKKCLLKVSVADLPGNVGTAQSYAFQIKSKAPDSDIVDVTTEETEPSIEPNVESKNTSGAGAVPVNTPDRSDSLFSGNTGGTEPFPDMPITPIESTNTPSTAKAPPKRREHPSDGEGTVPENLFPPIPDTDTDLATNKDGKATNQFPAPPVPESLPTALEDTKPSAEKPLPMSTEKTTSTSTTDDDSFKPIDMGTVENKPERRVAPNGRISSLLRRADKSLANQQPKQAVAYLKEAYAMDTGRPDTALRLSAAYLQAKDFRSAIDYAEAATTLDDRDVSWLAVGDAYFERAKDTKLEMNQEANPPRHLSIQLDRDIKQALTAYARSTRANSRFVDGYNGQGNVYHFQARMYKPTLATERDQAARYYRLAIEAYKKGFKNGTIKYDEAFQVGQSYYRLYQATGDVKNLTEGQSYLESAVEKASADRVPKEAYWYLAVIHEAQQHYQTAASYWLQAAKAYKKDAGQSSNQPDYSALAMQKHAHAKRLAAAQQ